MIFSRFYSFGLQANSYDGTIDWSVIWETGQCSGEKIANLPHTIERWLTIIHKYLYNWIQKDDDGKINGFIWL